MKQLTFRHFVCLSAMLGWSLVYPLMGQETLPTPLPILEGPIAFPPPGETDGVNNVQDLEELAQGPVHEAFAEQITFDPVPGPIVPEAPPPDVSELPPEFKPEGDNVVFIGGYWFWDDDRQSHIWISGGYRQLPPDQTWVDGYWHEVDGGWQRVSGFFATTAPETSSYYRMPPESLELGPVGQAPSTDHSWSPGYWESQGEEYVWRVGHWYECRPNWVWVPRYWRWTPRGCVLVGGYWDFPWEQRGQIFAPVCFHRPVYAQVGWSYRPRIILRAAALQLHLFVRPNYCHYYFGDYYGAGFAQTGFIPWHAYHTRYNRVGCDPIFAYNNWNYRRQGLDFVNISVQWNRYFDQHPNYRPPRTFGAQQNFIQNIQNNITINNTQINNTIINQSVLTDRLDRAAQASNGARKWARLDDLQLQQELQTSQKWRDSQRRRAESESASVFLKQHEKHTIDPQRQRQVVELAQAQQQSARVARKQAEEQLQRKQNPGQNNGGARSKVAIDRSAERDLQRQLKEQLTHTLDKDRGNLPTGKRRNELQTAENPRHGVSGSDVSGSGGTRQGGTRTVTPRAATPRAATPRIETPRPNTPLASQPESENRNPLAKNGKSNEGARSVVKPRFEINPQTESKPPADSNPRGRDRNNDRNNKGSSVPGLLPVPVNPDNNRSGIETPKIELPKVEPLKNDRGNDRAGRIRSENNGRTVQPQRERPAGGANRTAAGEVVVPVNPGEKRPFHVPPQQAVPQPRTVPQRQAVTQKQAAPQKQTVPQNPVLPKPQNIPVPRNQSPQRQDDGRQRGGNRVQVTPAPSVQPPPAQVQPQPFKPNNLRNNRQSVENSRPTNPKSAPPASRGGSQLGGSNRSFSPPAGNSGGNSNRAPRNQNPPKSGGEGRRQRDK